MSARWQPPRPLTAVRALIACGRPGQSSSQPADCTPSRDDVGRHNAVEKVAGHSVLIDRRPASHWAGWVLMVSGRISFEIVQKAAVCGLGIMAAVSAPSSLAVATAELSGWRSPALFGMAASTSTRTPCDSISIANADHQVSLQLRRPGAGGAVRLDRPG